MRFLSLPLIRTEKGRNIIIILTSSLLLSLLLSALLLLLSLLLIYLFSQLQYKIHNHPTHHLHQFLLKEVWSGGVASKYIFN